MQSAVPLACFLSLIRPPGIQFENALLQIAPVDKAKCPFVRDHSDIEFRLYTRHNPQVYEALRIGDDEKLFASSIDFHVPTVIYFHAFMETPDDGSALAIREAYVLRGDTNVIMVDASRLEAGPWYFTAAENTWYIGSFAAQFIDWLVSRGLDLKNTHLVGHSLGAQAAGVAGAALKSGRVSRITGLDPALPLFAHLPEEQKLDPSDGDFVDVIHTDAGIFGVNHPVGHVDFYPNGGISPQPGCELEVVIPEQLLLNKCENNPQIHGYYTFYLTPTENESRRKLDRNIYKLFTYLQTVIQDSKVYKKSIAFKDIVQNQNNPKINNSEIKLEQYSLYEKDTTPGYYNTTPNNAQEYNLKIKDIPLSSAYHSSLLAKGVPQVTSRRSVPNLSQGSVFKDITPDYNKRITQNNITLNNPEINNQNMKEEISTHVHNNMKINNYTEVRKGARTLEIHIHTEDIQETAKDRIQVEDQLMVESIQKHRAIPVLTKDGLIIPYILQQRVPQEMIFQDFKIDANQPNLRQKDNKPTLTENDRIIQYNKEIVQKQTKTEKQDALTQDTLEQNLPQEVINREFKNGNQPGLVQNNQESVDTSIQTHEDINKGSPSLTINTQNPPSTIQENISPKPANTGNPVLKRQKRFLSLFKRNEAQESDNFLFRMLEFLLKNRKTVVPVFTVMREINTLVKSTNGELNHVSKERNNYIGAPPPVLTPVTYNLELGNENRAVVFVKKLLGLTPKGDRLSISGTGK